MFAKVRDIRHQILRRDRQESSLYTRCIHGLVSGSWTTLLQNFRIAARVKNLSGGSSSSPCTSAILFIFILLFIEGAALRWSLGERRFGRAHAVQGIRPLGRVNSLLQARIRNLRRMTSRQKRRPRVDLHLRFQPLARKYRIM